MINLIDSTVIIGMIVGITVAIIRTEGAVEEDEAEDVINTETIDATKDQGGRDNQEIASVELPLRLLILRLPCCDSWAPYWEK